MKGCSEGWQAPCKHNFLPRQAKEDDNDEDGVWDVTEPHLGTKVIF